MTTKYTAAELEHHLAYEIGMLNGSYALIPKIEGLLAGASNVEKEIASNAMKEDFSLHARLLLEFFYSRRENSASGFANSTYSPPDEPKLYTRKLNNQIAHFMDARTLVESDKIGEIDRTSLLRWIDTELQRWLKVRECAYANISIPCVDLSLVLGAGSFVPVGSRSSATNTIHSVGGPTGAIRAPSWLALPAAPAGEPRIQSLGVKIGLAVAAFIILVIVVRLLKGALGY